MLLSLNPVFFIPPSFHTLTQALESSPAEIIACRHRSTSRHWAQGARKMDGCKRSLVQSSPLPASGGPARRPPAVLRAGMAGGFEVNPEPLNAEPVNGYV